MKIIKADFKNLKKAINLIKKGKVIVFPTDTVYGLLADATNKKAVERVFKIKRRSENKPIPIFVKDIRMARKLAVIDRNKGKFLKSVWPGKVTVVLPCPSPAAFGAARLGQKPKRKKLQRIAKNTIGLRIPNYKLVNILLQKLDKPLTGTSANISGKPASTKIKEVLKQFASQKFQPDLVIDAGNLKPSKPSTVLDLTGKQPKTLRT